MAGLNLDGLRQEVAGIQTVVLSVSTVVHKIADEVKALRNEGGGALQEQIDAIAASLHTQADALGMAVAEGTAADAEVPKPEPVPETAAPEPAGEIVVPPNEIPVIPVGTDPNAPAPDAPVVNQ